MARVARLLLVTTLAVPCVAGCHWLGSIEERVLAECSDPDCELACDGPDGTLLDNPVADDCRAIACVGGQRTEVVLDDLQQTAGDCSRRVCAGFEPADEIDDADVADDGDECTFESCAGGVPSPGDGYPCRFAEGASANYSCVVRGDGEVWCWGYNATGQLGRGSADASFHPVPEAVGGLPPASVLASGFQHSCAIGKADGVLRCWGGNPDGQLTGSTELENPVPAAVDLGQPVVGVATGSSSTCALLADETVRCWGLNDLGQLGDGTTDSRSTPAPVIAPAGQSGNLTGVVELAAGSNSICARLRSGSVTCWGSTALGDGSGPAAWPVPKPVAADLPDGATMIRAGNYHMVATLASGDVACWGYSVNGPCGVSLPDPAIVETPRLMGLESVTAVGAGWRHSCALGGGVSCWGFNAYGAIGIGSDVQTLTVNAPANVVGLPDHVDALGVYWTHSCARAGKDLYCWGSNYFGELGVPPNGDYATTAQKVEWPL